MDIFMIVMTIVLAILLIIGSIYLLAYYCHPDDRGFGSALICKIVVVLGMALSWAQVLMLPLDVSNARGAGGIRMDTFWIIIYLATAVFIVVIIPTLSAYYEADSEWTCWEKIKYSFCYLIVTIVVLIAILIITYVLLSKAAIPITSNNCSITNIQQSNSPSFPLTGCIIANTTLIIDVSFPIFVIGLMSFISWFFFVIFGGIGLAALPLDFFYDFCTRPVRISQSELKYLKERTVKRSRDIEKVLHECKTLESQKVMENGFWNKEKRRYKELLHQSQAGVLILEREYNKIEIQKTLNGKCGCHYYFLLIIGFVSLLISLAWMIHMYKLTFLIFSLLYFIIQIDNQPIYPFLNNLLTALVQANVSFLATAFFVMFCMYLLWATIKGNIKFGLRVLLCWSLHPMKKDDTYMNSFLFNVMIILLTSVSVTQFCAASFKDYCSMTDIDLIFSTQIRYLYFFVYFYKYHIFEYSLFGIAILSTIYLLCRPSDINSVSKIYEKKEEEMKLKFNSDSQVSKI